MSRCALIGRDGFVKYLSLSGEKEIIVLPKEPPVDVICAGEFAPESILPICRDVYRYIRQYVDEFGNTTRIYEWTNE